LFLFLFFAVLRIKPKASHMQGKHSTAEPSQPLTALWSLILPYSSLLQLLEVCLAFSHRHLWPSLPAASSPLDYLVFIMIIPHYLKHLVLLPQITEEINYTWKVVMN
jgi:hypothetical protein